MKDDINAYPNSLAGSYIVSFLSLTLEPILLIDTKPTDYKLKEIRFEAAGLATAEFENGITYTLYVTFDEASCTYLFNYRNRSPRKPNEPRQTNHSFQIVADLGMRVSNVAQVTSWVDLAQLGREED